MQIVEWIFWLCVFAIAYVYAGYPLVLLLLAKLRPAPPVAARDWHPQVTMVISAYNEEAVIAGKLANCLELDYPKDRLQILVVSDASSDRTDEITQTFAGQGVTLLRMEQRSGKTLGLNRAVSVASGEIIVFSDANAMYRRDAISRLTSHFADSRVGMVTGEQRYYSDEGAGHAAANEGLYWRYEQLIKVQESRLSSVVGGDGAVCAVRKALFEPLRPEDLSDFVTPLQVVGKGYRNVYDSDAAAYEHGSPNFGKEYRRKVRIVNRAWRALWRVPEVTNPLRVGVFAWQVVSHKLLRWLVPVLMLGALISNIALLEIGGIYKLALAAQGVLYGCATLGAFFGSSQSRYSWLIRVPFYFCLVNIASLHGLVDAFRGRTYTTWATVRG